MAIAIRVGIGAVILLLPALPLRAQPVPGAPLERPAMTAARVATAPAIDGHLDDAAWQGAPLPTGEFRSYSPLHGDQIPQHTTVWAAFDNDALYFAFRCDDPDPSGIKTSITRRDNIFADDWVGLSLDALGTGQSSYHLMVNPSGIQLDMLNTVSGDEDLSPDWIWESAGAPTETGYGVEIRIPLQSIRFQGGDNVRMGILFWRRVSRIGVSVAWPALEPGKWVFDKHASLLFPHIDARPTREVIPSAVFSRDQTRLTDRDWISDDAGDVGVSAKWGITSTVTLDATLNPDFSQVESDAYQVEVNQRFPVFFSEKRPFFMEGAGLFTLAGNAQGDASMLYAVHTRRIVDPIAGAKLTGTSGRVTYGTLTANDEAPGRIVDDADPARDQNQFWQVARAQVSLKPGSYAGAIGTFTEFAGRRNTVAGADLNLRLNDTQRLTAFVLASTTDGGRRDRDSSGFGGQLTYNFNRRRNNVQAQIEHYDRGFVMDTAFLNRVGITNGWAYVDVNFYPDKARYPWIRRIVPFTFFQAGRDRLAGGDEYISVSGVRMNFTRQGFLRIDQGVGREPWLGRRFRNGRSRMWGEVQLLRWLRVDGRVTRGPSVFYDDIDPFQGRSTTASAGMTLQPSGRFTQSLDYEHIAFDRESTRVRVYTVDILNARSTYQFTKGLSARAIVRYDSQRERILTDFLGSFEPHPGTVVFAGYGSLFEKVRPVEPDGVLTPQDDYLTTRRGLFFKASYLRRF